MRAEYIGSAYHAMGFEVTHEQVNTLVDTGLTAAGNAIFPVIGGAITHALGGLVGQLFGHSNNPERNAPQDVKDWIHYHAPNIYMDWYRPNVGDFSSTQKLKVMYAPWAWAHDKSLINPNNKDFYIQGDTERAYDAIGIDYQATVGNALAKGISLNEMDPKNVIMRGGGGNAAAPAPALDAIRKAVAAGRGGGRVTPTQAKILDSIDEHAPMSTTEKALLAGLGVVVIGGVAYAVTRRTRRNRSRR